ncbi:hypothetical protein H7H82_16430 [Mycobacterium heidelbergense]|uniref:Uncharacterized protein n=1 Tax=Mycobacterium heidelbergense TaxID=53376 RepID=A0A1X0DIV8_MYCHE|nr:hypothetical protein [Mycobacterium heidelbergense]MCV7052163.1 hypothetical protein [Mycobacterium heidelbergense]ORA72285.1 hypothetical protein BST25_15105 [Mycobacterium heidelbergense]BBZ52892.1 hypothetical protein MHEI_46090 [Mycobacterium heidelbergense]
MSLFGYLTVLAGVAELVFATFVFMFVKRLLGRSPSPIGEEIGGSKKVLDKLRRGEPMSKEELDFARQTVADRGSLLAFSLPAAVFAIGCFYVFGSLELHGTRSLRTLIGLGPLFGSINITIRLLRVAALKRRLRDVP